MRNLNKATMTGLALVLAASLGAAGSFAQSPSTAPTAPAAKDRAPAGQKMVPPMQRDTMKPGAAKKMERDTRSDLGAKSELIGLSAFSSDGKLVGRVAKVVKSSNGRIAQIHITKGGVLGIGAKTAKVPYDQVDRKGRQVLLPMTEQDVTKLFR